jgi:hypothetical protein
MTAAAANAAMTIPTMAPVLRLDFARPGSTGKKAWGKNVSSLLNNCYNCWIASWQHFVVVHLIKKAPYVMDTSTTVPSKSCSVPNYSFKIFIFFQSSKKGVILLFVDLAILYSIQCLFFIVSQENCWMLY